MVTQRVPLIPPALRGGVVLSHGGRFSCFLSHGRPRPCYSDVVEAHARNQIWTFIKARAVWRRTNDAIGILTVCEVRIQHWVFTREYPAQPCHGYTTGMMLRSHRADLLNATDAVKERARRSAKGETSSKNHAIRRRYTDGASPVCVHLDDQREL